MSSDAVWGSSGRRFESRAKLARCNSQFATESPVEGRDRLITRTVRNVGDSEILVFQHGCRAHHAKAGDMGSDGHSNKLPKATGEGRARHGGLDRKGL